MTTMIMMWFEIKTCQECQLLCAFSEASHTPPSSSLWKRTDQSENFCHCKKFPTKDKITFLCRSWKPATRPTCSSEDRPFGRQWRGGWGGGPTKSLDGGPPPLPSELLGGGPAKNSDGGFCFFLLNSPLPPEKALILRMLLQ